MPANLGKYKLPEVKKVKGIKKSAMTLKDAAATAKNLDRLGEFGDQKQTTFAPERGGNPFPMKSKGKKEKEW